MKTSRLALPVCILVLISGASAFATEQSNQPLTGSMLDQPHAPAAQPAQTYPLASGRGQPTPFGDNTVTGKTVAAPAPAPKAVAKAPPPLPPAPEPVAAPPVAAPPIVEPVAMAPKPRQFGDTTRDLLKLQASGDAAGKKLPILGDEASASYKRYVDSFSHPLPEYYQPAVKVQGTGNGGN